MENEISEHAILENIIDLPDNILFSFAKNYATKKDGLALALSGAFGRRFASFYGDIVDQNM